jgi:hypothetical protein
MKIYFTEIEYSFYIFKFPLMANFKEIDQVEVRNPKEKATEA